ncbi:MAG: IclR family transcriptional regulator [Anaerolineales bacterium]|nr:IclR family transcriptional regulator [Anaerolineales bacterium]
MDKSEPKSVRAVERAIDVLNVIKNSGWSAGVSEISQELGLAKSTVHRLLVALTNKGIVRQNEDTGRYSFGYSILEMAYSASQQWDVISLAVPYLEELRDRTGETAALALKVGLQYTYVTQIISPHEYRVNPELGHQYPLHWAATGKAILAYVRDQELKECLEQVPHNLATLRTIADSNELLMQLEEIRRLNYAISFGERNLGSSAIASPILDRQGYATAAACLIGPESRVRPQDLHKLGTIVAEISKKIQLACHTVGIGC